MLFVQAVHLLEPVGAKVPAAHTPHVTSLVLVQGAEGAYPAPQSLQNMQTVLPLVAAYELAAHGEHDDAPTAADWPAGHGAQTVLEVAVHADVGALPPGQVVQAVQVDDAAAVA